MLIHPDQFDNTHLVEGITNNVTAIENNATDILQRYLKSNINKQKDFANTSIRYHGELGLPDGQGWTYVAGDGTGVLIDNVFMHDRKVLNLAVAGGTTALHKPVNVSDWRNILINGGYYFTIVKLKSVVNNGIFSGCGFSAANDPRPGSQVQSRTGFFLYYNTATNTLQIRLDGQSNVVLDVNPNVGLDEYLIVESDMLPSEDNGVSFGDVNLYVNDIKIHTGGIIASNNAVNDVIQIQGAGSSGSVDFNVYDFGINIGWNIYKPKENLINQVLRTGLVSYGKLELHPTIPLTVVIPERIVQFIDKTIDYSTAVSRPQVNFTFSDGLNAPDDLGVVHFYEGVDGVIFGSAKTDWSTPEQRRDFVYLGNADVNLAKDDFVQANNPLVSAFGLLDTVGDMLAIGGSIKGSGGKVTATNEVSSPLGLDISGYTAVAWGRNFDNPKLPHTPTSLDIIEGDLHLGYKTSDISMLFGESVNNIDPSQYQRIQDITLSPVPSGNYTIQRVYQYPGTTYNMVLYGSTLYLTLNEAIANASTERYNLHPSLVPACLLAYIIVQEGVVNLSDAIANGRAKILNYDGRNHPQTIGAETSTENDLININISQNGELETLAQNGILTIDKTSTITFKNDLKTSVKLNIIDVNFSLISNGIYSIEFEDNGTFITSTNSNLYIANVNLKASNGGTLLDVSGDSSIDIVFDSCHLYGWDIGNIYNVQNSVFAPQFHVKDSNFYDWKGGLICTNTTDVSIIYCTLLQIEGTTANTPFISMNGSVPVGLLAAGTTGVLEAGESFLRIDPQVSNDSQVLVSGQSLSGNYFETNGLQGTFTAITDASSIQFLNASAQNTYPAGLIIIPDGTKLFTLDQDLAIIFAYDLTIPFNPSSGSYNGEFLDVSNEESYPTGITINVDTGNEIFMVGRISKTIYAYDLTTPFDLLSGSYNNEFLDVSAQNAYPVGVNLVPGGSQILTIDQDTATIYSYNLTTPLDLLSGSYNGGFLDVSAQNAYPTGAALVPDGSQISVINENSIIYSYTFTTPFDLLSGSYNNEFLDVSAQNSLPTGVTFIPDGTKLLTIDEDTVNGYSYDLTMPFNLLSGKISLQLSINTVADDGTGFAQFNVADTTFYIHQQVIISNYASNVQYNGNHTVIDGGVGFFVIATPFASDEAGGLFAANSVIVSDLGTSLSNGDTLTLTSAHTLSYDGGAIVYNRQPNSFQLNRIFDGDSTGTWNTSGLDQSDRRVLAFNNPSHATSKYIGAGYMNGNITENTGVSITNLDYTDMVLGAPGKGLISASNIERWKIVDPIIGIFEYIGNEPFSGFIEYILNSSSTGSIVEFRYKWVIDTGSGYQNLPDDKYAKNEISGVTLTTSDKIPLSAVQGDRIKPQITRELSNSPHLIEDINIVIT